uniref:HMG box domain-containing protein n=1 Tax=Piliocolobus tephrosceles TaxID=591936 RepID=A0A8C9IU45_9PRIM
VQGEVPSKDIKMALPRNQGHWSNEDILRLLERIENNLPSDGKGTFSSIQSHMDWGKAAFKNFSGEMCRLKWLEISCSLRKYGSLKELVLEAKKCVKNTDKSQKGRNHPDFPKRPLTAYIRFFKENWPQYSQMYPGMRSQELTKILSKKYKELPEDVWGGCLALTGVGMGDRFLPYSSCVNNGGRFWLLGIVPT